MCDFQDVKTCKKLLRHFSVTWGRQELSVFICPLSSGQLLSLHKTPGSCMPVVTSEDLNKKDSLGNALLFDSWLTDVGEFYYSGFQNWECSIGWETVFLPWMWGRLTSTRDDFFFPYLIKSTLAENSPLRLDIRPTGYHTHKEIALLCHPLCADRWALGSPRLQEIVS